MKKLLNIALASTFILAASAPTFAEGDAKKGERVFKKCKACHSMVVGKRSLGPSLAGVIGRTAGTLEGYKYSPAMKDSGVVWSAETLAEYLKKPRDFIKGTKMTFPGIRGSKADEQIADLFAFLQQ